MKPSVLGYYLRNEIRTGGHRRYLELLNSLSKKGFDVTVFIGDSIDTTEFSFKSIPLKPVYKGRKIPFSIKQLIRVLPEIIKLKKGNWVTVAFGESNYPTMVAVKLILKAKIIFAFRSNSYKAKYDQFILQHKKLTLKMNFQLLKMKHLERKITKISDKLVFQTKFDSDDIIARTKTIQGKSVIIPNSIRESWFDINYKNINSSQRLQNIIYLGSYDNRKGAIYLLNAINILNKKNIKLNVEFYGYGREKSKLIEYVMENGLEDRITINDKMSNPLSKMGEYDLMVVPSIYDSYPNVILESIFTGTPVLASNNSGMKEILKFSELLFETGNYFELADKIEKLVNNNLEYIKIKELCCSRQKAHDFNWAEMFVKEIV